jgi:hypothetical protein
VSSVESGFSEGENAFNLGENAPSVSDQTTEPPLSTINEENPGPLDNPTNAGKAPPEAENVEPIQTENEIPNVDETPETPPKEPSKYDSGVDVSQDDKEFLGKLDESIVSNAPKEIAPQEPITVYTAHTNSPTGTFDPLNPQADFEPFGPQADSSAPPSSPVYTPNEPEYIPPDQPPGEIPDSPPDFVPDAPSPEPEPGPTETSGLKRPPDGPIDEAPPPKQPKIDDPATESSGSKRPPDDPIDEAPPPKQTKVSFNPQRIRQNYGVDDPPSAVKKLNTPTSQDPSQPGPSVLKPSQPGPPETPGAPPTTIVTEEDGLTDITVINGNTMTTSTYNSHGDLESVMLSYWDENLGMWAPYRQSATGEGTHYFQPEGPSE